MKHSLIILSILLLSSPLFGQSERPETIIIPVSSLGDVSEVRKQILQNTLEDELKTHFRLIPQQRFEEVREKVFEELEYEECTEDQCIMMIQEMLQVENVFHLQVIGEGSDTQLSLGWRTLDEKKKETDICLKCGTFQLNDKVRGLVEKLVGGKKVEPEPVVVVSRDDDELKKKQAEGLKRKQAEELKRKQVVELKRKKEEEELKEKQAVELKKKEEDELKKKEEDELKRKEEDELKRKVMIPYFQSRKLSFSVGGCQTNLHPKIIGVHDNSSINVTDVKFSGYSIETKYYLNEKLLINGVFCSGSPTEITNELESQKGEILSGTTNNTSISLNYGWNLTSFSTYVGGGISSHASKIEYIDPISKLNQIFDINHVFLNINLGFEYIGLYNELFYIVNVGTDILFGIKSFEITNNNNEYEINGMSIFRLNFGTSF